MVEPGGIGPITRESTASMIARQLRKAIMNGTLAPGSQLGETDLASRFRVSRGPLREAMQRLAQEGLLRSERNRGLFVITLDKADIEDVYLARAAVERAAVPLILRRQGQPADAAEKLAGVHADMADAAKANDLRTLFDADLRFHQVLVAASGSPRLVRMHGTLLVESRMCMTALESAYRQALELVVEHGELIQALRDGDQQRMMELIQEHMDDALNRLL